MADRHRRVRLQEEQRHRLADERAAPDHDGPLTGDRDAVLAEQVHDAERRRRDERLAAEVELAGAERVQSVDVLHRIDRPHHARFVDLLGQRRLDEDPVDLVVLVQLFDELDELVLGRRGGQAMVDRLDADLLCRLVLEADVDLRRRIVADQHGRETHTAELRDVVLQLPAQACREGGPVHQRRAHGRLDAELDAADVQPQRLRQADAELEVLAEANGVAGLHGPADPGALARPPHGVRRELG